MLEKLRKERGDEGFTLIELLVVIIIIGILAAIAIPVFLNQRQKGWEAAVKSDLRNAATAQETLLTETNAYTNDVDDLFSFGFKYSDDKNYLSGASITSVAVGNEEYCMTATAASNKTFYYSSPGGLSDVSC
jgi:type IV pilus assembly protein PilA